MRQGNGKDGFLFGDNNELQGFQLTADFCAEHEWGIKNLNSKLGVDPYSNVLGVDRYLISKTDSISFMTFKKNKVPMAILTSKTFFDSDDKKDRTKELMSMVAPYRYDPSYHTKDPDFQTCAGAWDERDFLFLVSGKENVERLFKIHQAFHNKDITVSIGGIGAFSNGCLFFCIRSLFSKEENNKLIAQQKSQSKLEKVSDDTGIEEILKASNKKWFCLKPEWKDEEETEIHWWLNPQEQHIHNFGWFNLEQLKEWASNKGPIMKTESKG